MQSFEISACLFSNNAPLTLTLIVRKLRGLIYKTASCGLILCDSKDYWDFFLLIGVLNDTKRKEIN